MHSPPRVDGVPPKRPKHPGHLPTLPPRGGSTRPLPQGAPSMPSTSTSDPQGAISAPGFGPPRLPSHAMPFVLHTSRESAECVVIWPHETFSNQAVVGLVDALCHGQRRLGADPTRPGARQRPTTRHWRVLEQRKSHRRHRHQRGLQPHIDSRKPHCRLLVHRHGATRKDGDLGPRRDFGVEPCHGLGRRSAGVGRGFSRSVRTRRFGSDRVSRSPAARAGGKQGHHIP